MLVEGYITSLRVLTRGLVHVREFD